MSEPVRQHAADTRTSEGNEPLEFRLLGQVDVLVDGTPLDLGVYKQRALMALLLIHANEVVSTDRIIDELWGESSGRDRQSALWVVVSRLRTALEPDRETRSDGTILLSRPPGYVLSVDNDAVDAFRFEKLAVEGRALLETDPGAASLVLSEALGMWRGHALEEFMYESFAAAEVTRLEELRLAAVEDRVDADLRIGRDRQLIGELESLVRQHPARERMTGHLMLALHLSGRQSDALRAFGRLSNHLAEELGLEPSTEISRLEERIVLDDPALRQGHAVRGLASSPEPGLSVRGYELREKIGEGATGIVYRAFQPAVGREVAIKVIRSELANDPKFIRQFEAEAQLISRLEHPQIVPVFDYWREPDAAFLVTRRFEHGSLSDLVDAVKLTVETAVDLVSQIGGALAAAHRQGVVHGDLKPNNVLIDRDGNAHLADFGMSSRRYAAAESSDGSDEFSAPEQRESGLATTETDIYSLGVIADDLLAGIADDGGLNRVADVIRQATAELPIDRYPNVESFMEALAIAGGDAAGPQTPIDIVNPYVGLHAFDEGDAERFFGRERLVERLLARLDAAGPQGRFIAVVGPSGSGKSSVVRAGVIPALRAGGARGSDAWFIATMVPGRHPFEALEDALRTIAVDPPPSLLETLTTEGIAAAVEALIADPGSQVVIVIDQLEELFSLASERDADEFMTAIAAATGDRHSRIKVIATLRADFYDHPLRHNALGELIRLGTEVVTPMNAAELERAVTAPAQQLGVSFQTGLVALIAADMAGQSTALPLLQYALTELFEQRTGNTIAVDAYHELGGVSAALARRANGVYEGLAGDDRTLVRDMFLRLVTLNEGGANTRRRALLSELTDAGRENVAPLLEAFGRHRLLTFDRDAITRGPTVEIAHEALLTEWARLEQWIDDSRADIQAERALATAVAEWHERNRDTDFLLSGARLGRYHGWLDHPPVSLTSDEREYLVASREASRAEIEVERRRVRRLRRLVAGVGGALVIALIAGGAAVQQQRRANDEARRAEDAATAAEAQTEVAKLATEEAQLATLISRSAAFVEDDPDLSLLLALEAFQRAPGAASEQAVLNVLSGASFGSRVASRPSLIDDCFGGSLLVRQFGGMLEFATVDGEMIGRDPLTGQILGRRLPPADCTAGGFTDESGGAQTLDGGTLWFGADLDVQVELEPPSGAVLALVDRALVYEQGTDSRPPRAIVLDPRTGERVGEPIVGDAGEFFVDGSAMPNVDGSIFAMGFTKDELNAGEVVLVEAATGAVLRRIDVPFCCFPITWEASTGYLILGFGDGLIRTVDADTGETVTEVQLDLVRGPLVVGVRPDGTLIVVTASDIILVDRSTGPIGRSIRLQNIQEALVRPDGLVVTANQEGQLDVFDPEASALIREIDVDPGGRVGFDAGRAAIKSFDGDRVEIIDLSTGERSELVLRMPNGETFVAGAAYPEPDGAWAVSLDLVLARWEGDNMVESIQLGSTGEVVGIPYGPKPAGTRFGDLYAVVGVRPDGSTEATLALMRRDEAAVLFTIDVPNAQWAHPTVDGGLYVHGDDGVLRIYDSGGELIDEITTGAKDTYAFTLDPAGTKLTFGDLGGIRDDTSNEEGGTFIVDLATGQIDRVPQAGIVSTMAFKPGGSQLVMAMFDGTVRLWDVEAGGVATIVWTGSGQFDSEPGWYDEASDSIWTLSGGKLLNIPLNPQRWVARACELVSRELTQEEWDRFVPGDQPLRSSCG